MFSWIMFSPIFILFFGLHVCFVVWYQSLFTPTCKWEISKSKGLGWNPEWVILFVKIQELSDFTLLWPL